MTEKSLLVSPTSTKHHQSVPEKYLIQIICLEKGTEMKNLYSERWWQQGSNYSEVTVGTWLSETREDPGAMYPILPFGYNFRHPHDILADKKHHQYFQIMSSLTIYSLNTGYQHLNICFIEKNYKFCGMKENVVTFKVLKKTPPPLPWWIL